MDCGMGDVVDEDLIGARQIPRLAKEKLPASAAHPTLINQTNMLHESPFPPFPFAK
jgi:hypothetical protein